MAQVGPAGTVDDALEDDLTGASENRYKKKIDWDRIFSYRTLRIVRIKDRHLGILYWSIVTIVIFYIIIVAFGIHGKHQRSEHGVGTVITRMTGKAFVEGKHAYDEADLRFPEIEPYGAFIMTKFVEVRDQKPGKCVDYDNPCPCRKEAVCGAEGFCEDQAWCPSLGDGNAAKPPDGAITATMEGLEHLVFKIHAGIAFPSLGNFFFVAGKSANDHNPYHNITLGKLLSLSTPPITIKEVLDTGALLGVSFFWLCDVNTDCEPTVVVKRLDNGRGFTQKKARHRTTGEGTARDAIYMYGLRILVDSSGIGRRASMVLIIIQIGSGLALLKTASITSDFLMLQLYPERRAKVYRKCKILETRDYSDLKDRINLIHEYRNETKNLLGMMNKASEAGPNVMRVGPPSGGRGGMAGNLLV